METIVKAALTAAFFVSDASVQVCDSPDDVKTLIAAVYPESYLLEKTGFTSAEAPIVHHALIFRSPEATADFAVFFNDEPGAWCAATATEIQRSDRGTQ